MENRTSDRANLPGGAGAPAFYNPAMRPNDPCHRRLQFRRMAPSRPISALSPLDGRYAGKLARCARS